MVLTLHETKNVCNARSASWKVSNLSQFLNKTCFYMNLLNHMNEKTEKLSQTFYSWKPELAAMCYSSSKTNGFTSCTFDSFQREWKKLWHAKVRNAPSWALCLPLFCPCCATESIVLHVEKRPSCWEVHLVIPLARLIALPYLGGTGSRCTIRLQVVIANTFFSAQ